jgi:oxygen-independent coproporphyrinogen-3 oxidase
MPEARARRSILFTWRRNAVADARAAARATPDGPREGFATERRLRRRRTPRTLSPAAARDAAAGVTRLGRCPSPDRELLAVGRRHDAAAARRALEVLAGAGLSLSGDLILGLPEQTQESFRASLQELSRSGAGHVSIYLLETDKSKATAEDRRLRPARYLSDDAQADLWLEARQTLAREGFSHYEI